jgi:hypothetical protein
MAGVEGIPGLAVWLRPDRGGWRIQGQHLGTDAPGGEEYEYAMSIAEADVPRLASALGTDLAGIPLAWDAQVQAIVLGGGERRWLLEHDIPFEFWSRIG